MSKNVDMVNHPPHYTKYPVECIDLMERFQNPLLANVFKYAWRAGDKGNLQEDLGKIEWYLKRYEETELHSREKMSYKESFDILRESRMLPKRLAFLETLYNFQIKKSSLKEIREAKVAMEEELWKFEQENKSNHSS